ncbi:MAG TPA: hypothetical protein VFW93_09410 [Aquabacterium sp.]|uniref:hypothetical protein n=1 Tax=Aquabacterium sp. TaxID=1872578 RepID=UPI002E361C5A|nr:hypothetical protein [Aquabacterium sp.]HEX5356425.1 hypothetical protein [Aquabacterium sp.]
MSIDLDSSDSSVYQRTHKGQIVAAGQASSIDHELILWLRMVNGLTPTHALMTLAGMSAQDTRIVIDRLLALGLIQRC